LAKTKHFDAMFRVLGFLLYADRPDLFEAAEDGQVIIPRLTEFGNTLSIRLNIMKDQIDNLERMGYITDVWWGKEAPARGGWPRYWVKFKLRKPRNV